MKDNKYSLINYEIFRYKQKGVLNTVIGISTVIAFFLLAPYIGQNYFAGLIEEYIGGQQKLNFLILMASLHLIFTLGNFAYYLPLYMQKIPFLEKYRINRIEDWEWNKPEWPQLKKRFIQTYLLNHFVLLPGFIALDLFVRGSNISFRTSVDTFPSLWEFFSQIVFCIFVDDTVFYFIHWAAHLPMFYKTIHKKHHEYKNPFSLAGEFDSISEYFLAGTLPPLMAFSFLGSRTHMWTYLCYVFLKIGKQADQHCGYELPFSVYHALPFTGSGISHTFHHTHNEGAIGSFFSIWDHIMQTDKEFIKYFYAYYEKKNNQQQQQKENKHSNPQQQKVKQQ